MSSISTIPLMGTPMPDPAITAGRYVALRNLQAQQQQDQVMNPLRVQEAQQVIQQHQLANQQAQKQMDIANRMERAYQSAMDGSHAASVNTPPPQATKPTPAVSDAASPVPQTNSAVPQSAISLSANSEASAGPSSAAVLGTEPVPGLPVTMAGLLPGGNLGTAPPAPTPPAATSVRNVPATPQPSGAPGPADSWNGAPPSFYSRLEQEFYKNGLGMQVPGMQKAHAELGIQMSKNVSDAMAAHQQQAEAATQLLQGIRNIQDPAQQDAEYQKIRPQFTALEQQMGTDSRQVPQHWDNGTMDPYIAQGYKVQEYTNHIHQAAEQGRVMQAGVLTEAPKATDYFQKELSGVTSPAQYTELRQRISNLAEAEKKANPGGTSFYQNVLDKYPKEWDQGMQRQATLASMPANDRPTYLQKDFANTAQRLSAAAQQGSQQYAAQLAQTAPEDRSLFDSKWTADTAENARRTGLTASQVGVEDMKDRSLSVAEMKAQFYEALAQARTDKLQNPTETPTQHRANITNLAYEAIQHSKAGGGGSPAQAKADVLNPDLYQGHPIEPVRGEVAQRLEDMQAQQGKEAATDRQGRGTGKSAATSSITSLTNARDWDRAHPGQARPSTDEIAKWKATQPGAAAPPVNTPAPNKPARGSITVTAGDGSTHPFADEAAAKRFEDLVKKAGGSTTRN
jgi:hypothetical protein